MVLRNFTGRADLHPSTIYRTYGAGRLTQIIFYHEGHEEHERVIRHKTESFPLVQLFRALGDIQKIITFVAYELIFSHRRPARLARPPRLLGWRAGLSGSRPACHARHERAGGGLGSRRTQCFFVLYRVIFRLNALRFFSTKNLTG
jgi:hypothetical protein